jgi:hypothetical protein
MIAAARVFIKEKELSWQIERRVDVLFGQGL